MNNRPLRNTHHHEQQQPLVRRPLVYQQRDRQEVAPPAGSTSSIAGAVGAMTEAIAYNLANGVNSANRTLWRLMVAIGIGSFLLGMLLMRTIDRELAAPAQQPRLGSEHNPAPR